MTSEKAANRARELFSDELFSKGAHALAVDKAEVDGKETFALIAMVAPSHKKPMPKSLSYSIGAKEIVVPVIVKKTPPFKPE